MMSEKTFAENYTREKVGDLDLIIFPRDVTWRRTLFPPKVFDHPAKNNMYLTEELVKYVSKPGDSVLDPFAGTGTLMIGALLGRNIVLIELEPHYTDLIKEAQHRWTTEGIWTGKLKEGDKPGYVILFEGDCRQKLQEMSFLCDSAVFSPPYAGSITRAKPIPSIAHQVEGYSASSVNMSNLNPFYFVQAMDKVYERLNARLVPGAMVGIIIKDTMKAGKREFLSEPTIKRMNRQGFQLIEWHKWKPPGSLQGAVQRSRGADTVQDEDILIFQKES